MKAISRSNIDTPRFMHQRAVVKSVNSMFDITAEDTLSLSNGLLAGIHIEGAVSDVVADLLVDNTTNQNLQGYSVEPGFQRNEQTKPLFESTDNIDRYFQSSELANWDAFPGNLPFISPASHLRLAYDNVWPEGAGLLRLEGNVCPFGLMRAVMPGSGGVLPHQDTPRWDYPCDAFNNANAALSAIFFLTDFDGGETTIFPVEYTSKADYDARIREDSGYGLDVNQLPDPIATVKAKKGDLLLINAVPATSNPRYTMSGFILHTPGKRLEMFI
jgi:hypothetical protein